LALKKFIKDPNAKLDYALDWTAWLTPFSDTLTAATASVTPTGGITLASSYNGSFAATATLTPGNYIATFWATGGTAGNSYDITVHVTTASGRQDDRTVTITCKEM